MSENGYELGGEQSGHIIFSKYANTGDGILTSLRLMEAMIDNKAKLSELRRDLKIYPQVLKNVKVKAVSYTHLTLPTIAAECRSRWSPDH